MTKVSRYLCVGPGGTSCACCFPARGKGRKAEFRSAKRKADKDVRRDIALQIVGEDDEGSWDVSPEPFSFYFLPEAV